MKMLTQSIAGFLFGIVAVMGTIGAAPLSPTFVTWPAGDCRVGVADIDVVATGPGGPYTTRLSNVTLPAPSVTAAFLPGLPAAANLVRATVTYREGLPATYTALQTVFGDGPVPTPSPTPTVTPTPTPTPSPTPTPTPTLPGQESANCTSGVTIFDETLRLFEIRSGWVTLDGAYILPGGGAVMGARASTLKYVNKRIYGLEPRDQNWYLYDPARPTLERAILIGAMEPVCDGSTPTPTPTPTPPAQTPSADTVVIVKAIQDSTAAILARISLLTPGTPVPTPTPTPIGPTVDAVIAFTPTKQPNGTWSLTLTFPASAFTTPPTKGATLTFIKKAP